MERIISSRDPELEESFTFSSCYDFNSSVIFSDDDEYLEIDGDDESYIEIALDRDGEDEDDEGEPDDEFELRISFSTHNYLTAPRKIRQNQLDSSDTEDTITESETPSSSSSTCSGPCPPPPVVVSQGISKSGSKQRNQFPAVNRLVNTFMLSLGFSSEMADQNGRPHQTVNQSELVSRKTSKRTMEMNGGITNLLIKFRAIKVGTLLSPFVKPRQVISCQENKKKKKKKKKKKTKESLQYNYRRLIKPLEKWLVQKDQGKGGSNNNIMKNCSGTGSGEKSRVMEMNLDAIRGVGVVQVMRMSSSTSGRKDKNTTSCPSSVKSSAVHKSETQKIYARENSIQAAIAHCKNSFGQTSDFRF